MNHRCCSKACKGTALVEILLAMALLAGLVLPLAIMGIKYASGSFARIRFERQLEPGRQRAELQRAAKDLGLQKALPGAIRVDTIQVKEKLYLRLSTGDSPIFLVEPIGE